MDKIKLGISIGDLNGIGPELVIRTLEHQGIFKNCIPVIYASAKVMSYHRNVAKSEVFSFKSVSDANNLVDNQINLINCWQENVTINLGTVTEEGGKYAHISLDRAVQDLKAGLIDALVTSPINKKAMSLANFPYKGHTDYLASEFKENSALMLMVSEDLRVAVLTHHIPLREVAAHITKEKISQTLEILNKSLVQDFDIEKPVIAVLGLNPHASDEGVIGEEEEEIIRPSIIESKKNGLLVSGPFPPDGFWGSGKWKKFDAILCMYHDQGLIPFKMHSFGHGVNVTVGLPFVRTSPDHGTAYDIVGTNTANESSFRTALYLAIDMAKNRKEYEEIRKNKLEKIAKPSEEVVE